MALNDTTSSEFRLKVQNWCNILHSRFNHWLQLQVLFSPVALTLREPSTLAGDGDEDTCEEPESLSLSLPSQIQEHLHIEGVRCLPQLEKVLQIAQTSDAL